jgi:hypothetical protein
LPIIPEGGAFTSYQPHADIGGRHDVEWAMDIQDSNGNHVAYEFSDAEFNFTGSVDGCGYMQGWMK